MNENGSQVASNYHDVDNAAQAWEAEAVGPAILRDQFAMNVIEFCLARRLAMDAFDDGKGKVRGIKLAAEEAYVIADVMLLARRVEEDDL